MPLFNIIKLDECSSTNTILKENKALYPSYTVLRCVKQTKGKGRWGREWFSQTEKGLYFSIMVNDISATNIRVFPLLITLSLLQFFEELKLSPEYQWPNDIYIKGKKIAGILSEGINKGDKTSLIIGVGININHNKDDFPEELKKKAISLKILKNKDFRIENIFEKILVLMEENIIKQEKIAELIMKIKKYSRFKKKENIIIKTREGEFEGIFLGYNPDSSILIEIDGKEKDIYEGEVLKIRI